MCFATKTITLIAIVGAGLAWQVVAQATTSVTCTTELFTENKEGDSPCLVAAALQGVCTDGIFNIPPLAPGRIYTGPLIGGSNVCTCSSVTYSMVAACGACQGAEVEFWSEWITNCSTSQVTVASFPQPLPQGVTVPAWAYLDVMTGNMWSATEAENVEAEDLPDSSASGPLPTSHPVTSNLPGTNSGGSKLNIPAIAGGAAGGGVALILIAVFIFIFIRRRNRRSRAALSKGAAGVYGEKVNFPGPGSGYPSDPIPVSVPYYGNSMATPEPAPTVQSDIPKLYDPADPSTFPDLPCSTSAAPGSTTAASSTYYGAPSASAQYGDPVQAPYGASITPYSDSGSNPYGAGATSYDGPTPSTPYGTATDYASYGPVSSPSTMLYGGSSRPFSQQMLGVGAGAGGYAPVPTRSPPPPGQPGGAYNGMPEL
ncbi:hypothetical protein K439DRAFT_1631062 [Ramaria rubella]|nr:hypothetical protein K439DRAFT_1631062 [Ramaria rubella]